jgi:hypothetical protein
MRLIDIDEDVYKSICDKYATFPKEMKEWGLEAIKNSIPLEQIRAEMKDLAKGEPKYVNGVMNCLEIIDKYLQRGDSE